ncbi:helix-turn-helix domain-containing protein [Salinibacter altiplanensis]|uniref:helix-turn-helix domain-containing protein n=1 Tax=Salinibacter altiplanensis TaxID=1803181 RepID=UPI000C9F283A|nr:helix-turn-helix transcriptional regulator [Salinibacter altiplanensis]
MPRAVDPRFGRKMRSIRQMRGMTQVEIAEKADVGHTYISRIENGHAPPPSTETIVRVADALDADADELLALAGKVAPDVEQMLIESPSLMDVVREEANAVPA